MHHIFSVCAGFKGGFFLEANRSGYTWIRPWMGRYCDLSLPHLVESVYCFKLTHEVISFPGIKDFVVGSKVI